MSIAVRPISQPPASVDVNQRLQEQRTDLQNLKRAQARLRKAEERHAEAREELRQSAIEARKTSSQAEVAEVLGITRQSLHKMLKAKPKRKRAR